MRQVIEYTPYDRRMRPDEAPYRNLGVWPCRWISVDEGNTVPFVAAYRRRFSVKKRVRIRVHVTADERYELFLNGERIGRGPERGSPDNWRFETYDLTFQPGNHVLVARVWSLGAELAPQAQMSRRHGFLFSPEGEEGIKLLGTGVAKWQGKRLGGYKFNRRIETFWLGSTCEIDGADYDWGHEQGRGKNWGFCVNGPQGVGGIIHNGAPHGHLLIPARLPDMLDKQLFVGQARLVQAIDDTDSSDAIVDMKNDIPDERVRWNNLLSGPGKLSIPPRSSRRIIIDLEDYYCGYPEWDVSGGKGASISLSWAESLFKSLRPGSNGYLAKGNRDTIDGKYFKGEGDKFLPDGGHRQFAPLWWSAGRYLEVRIETKDKPLYIHSVSLRETRYPLELESRFSASDSRIDRTIPMLVRGLQMCSHETFFDCPYYEQLMYAGDTRLEALAAYTMARDDRLQRKAIETFAQSMLKEGWTQSRYPSSRMQVIAPFCLFWVAMVRDFALWRDDLNFVRAQLHVVRSVIDAWLAQRGKNGLVHGPVGWNFLDWVDNKQWAFGIPPGGRYDVNSSFNAHLILTLSYVSDLEKWVGDKELVARAGRVSRELTAAFEDAFWDNGKQCYSDTPGGKTFSQHTQCLALLAGIGNAKRRKQIVEALANDKNLSRTSIYFSFYLLESLYMSGRMDAFFERLEEWFDLEKYGLKTPYESFPENTRSDCHAWGSHPLFHYFASILGIRPLTPGFSSVLIRPQLGNLTRASGKLVHPKGFISASFSLENGRLQGSISLPQGVDGALIHGKQKVNLHSGKQNLDLC